MYLPDLIILVATMGLNVAIVPTLRSVSKPPVVTSLGFAACVLTIGGALFSAGFWLGGAANVLAGSLWLVVVAQTIAMRTR